MAVLKLDVGPRPPAAGGRQRESQIDLGSLGKSKQYWSQREQTVTVPHSDLKRGGNFPAARRMLSRERAAQNLSQ